MIHFSNEHTLTALCKWSLAAAAASVGAASLVCVCVGAGGALPSCVFMWPDVYLST